MEALDIIKRMEDSNNGENKDKNEDNDNYLTTFERVVVNSSNTVVHPHCLSAQNLSNIMETIRQMPEKELNETIGKFYILCYVWRLILFNVRL